MRSRRVPGQIADEVPEGSSADSRQGSGGFRGRKLMRFYRVPVQMRFPRVPGQIADEVPEGSSADSRQGSGGFRGRKLMRFHRVPVQMRFPRVPGQIAKISPRFPKLLGVRHQKRNQRT